MYILGISAWYHDSAACLIKDGEIIAAVQEERFSRIKHDESFPINSIKYCLKEADILPSELESIVFYEKPFLKFERLIETYLAFAPRGFKSFRKSMPLWIKDKLFQKFKISKELEAVFGDDIKWSERLLFSEHHLSHAASAFYPSPFKKAAVLTIDAVGEWATTSIAVGNENSLKVLKEIHFPHSLGLLYSAFTYYAGFKVNSGEYKVMGLAPYGKPIFTDLIKDNLIDINNDGSFFLNMNYFDFCTGLTMTNNKFNRLFGGPPRKSETQITQKEMDIAASIQKITEEIVIKIARNIAKETNEEYLCLAGGVALNCVINGILNREKIFKRIWIQPAAGDAGGALGAALSIYYIKHKSRRNIMYDQDSMKGSYLGPLFNDDEIRKSLDSLNAIYIKKTDKEIMNDTANALTSGKAIGWMQGRMEFGPRALGNRSIIADPRSSFMQKQLNLKVKFRESFRPFAPSILYEHTKDWFNDLVDSPYMLQVCELNKERCIEMEDDEKRLFGLEKLNIPRSSVPAITHIDYSARIQTVHQETNSLYHKLINHFYKLTEVPLIVNTSFNVRGEPIVCSPMDAFKCFMGTELDILVVGNFFLIKEDQDKSLKKNYKDSYELD